MKDNIIDISEQLKEKKISEGGTVACRFAIPEINDFDKFRLVIKKLFERYKDDKMNPCETIRAIDDLLSISMEPTMEPETNDSGEIIRHKINHHYSLPPQQLKHETLTDLSVGRQTNRHYYHDGVDSEITEK